MPALLRLAGWSALAAGLVHLLQFVELGIGPALIEPEFPTPAESAVNYWFGLVGGTTFTLVGLAYVLFFHDPSHPAHRRTHHPGDSEATTRLIHPLPSRPAQRVLASRHHPLASHRPHTSGDP